ncbi:MAG: hypothetical protein ABJ205_08050 [Erythrobacter sp.]|uniref:hypothetical protein n=1 Tax=Erythrobacter sp. TaxID=1042 RepID=UPI003265CC42
MSEKARAFIERWRPVLESGALVHFAYGPCAAETGNHCQIADQFVEALGFKTIGFNWQLLDAGAPQGEVRSGLGELVKALTEDLVNPSRPWLSHQEGEACAKEFLDLFEAPALTLVSNRYDGLWNPIASAATEWGFVGFDHETTALLLLAER